MKRTTAPIPENVSNSAKSIPEKLDELAFRKNDAILWTRKITFMRDRFLLRLILIPVLIALLVFILMFIDAVRRLILGFLIDVLGLPTTSTSIYIFILFVYLIAVLLSAIPVLSRQLYLNRTGYELSEIEGEIEQLSLSVPDLQLPYLRKRFFVVAGEAIKTKWIDNNRREYSKIIQDEISNMLSELEQKKGAKRSSDQAPLLFDWDDVRIRLSQWSDLIREESDEKREGRNWKLMSILISVVYLVLILISIPYFNTQPAVFGVPFAIVIWSALGSFAAILYRFYKSPLRIKFEKEFRWLIARPIIGIVMGALSYLALVSGAIIFSITPSSDTSTNLQAAGQQWQYWIIAFLGGFSDKFYEKIIEWLTSKFTSGKEEEQEGNSQVNPEAAADAANPDKNPPEPTLKIKPV